MQRVSDRYAANIILVAGLIAVCSSCNKAPDLPPEPSYNGQSLSVWIAEASTVADDQDPAVQAVQRMGPTALPHLLAAFEKGELPTPAAGGELQVWDVRAKAAEIIKSLGTNAAPLAPTIVKYLDHEEERVREHAAEILGCTGVLSENVLRGLVHALGDSKCAFESSKSLARLGKTHTNVVHELAKVAKGKNRTAAEWATVSLENLGPDSVPVLPVLLELTRDASFGTRLAAVRTLALIEPKSEPAIRALTQALRDKEEWVRKCAVIALGRIGPQAHASVSALKALLDKGEPAYTRADIARALWRIQPEETQLPLTIAQAAANESLEIVHRGEGVPYALTSALFLFAEMGTNALPGLPTIVRAQQVKDPTVQFNAAWAAYRIDRSNRNEAEETLKKIANIENHPLDPKLQFGGPIGQILAAPKRERESYYIRLAAIGALCELDSRWQFELRGELVSLLKQWTHWTAMKSPIPELEVLVPALRSILADSSIPDVHPFATKVLDEVTGSAGERW